LQIPVMSAATY